MLSPSPFGRIATQQHHTISVLSLSRGGLAPFFLSYILYLLTCTILHHHTIDDDITTLHLLTLHDTAPYNDGITTLHPKAGSLEDQPATSYSGTT